MPNEKKSQFRNCIAVDDDGESSEIFCPVCGKGTMCTAGKAKCPHVLLIFSASTGDDGLLFDYTHPKLTAAVGRVKEKYVGHLPSWEGRDMDPRAWERFKKISLNSPVPQSWRVNSDSIRTAQSSCAGEKSSARRLVWSWDTGP